MSSELDFKKITPSQKFIMGDLQRLLNQGEYALFASVPMFESRFVQVKINYLNEIICHAQYKIDQITFFFPSSSEQFFLIHLFPPHLFSFKTKIWIQCFVSHTVSF